MAKFLSKGPGKDETRTVEAAYARLIGESER